ncbi:MAG: hypothetical protein SF097_02160 [Acidobacteriota bacterium]|nr:hypothetical protein [Acidobacteriota bacterium]
MFLPIDINSVAAAVTGVETIMDILLRLASNHNETFVDDEADSNSNR